MRKLFTAFAAAGLLFAASPSAQAAFEYTLSPAEGKVESLSTITLDFSGVAGFEEIEIVNKEGEMTVKKDGATVATGDASKSGSDKVVYTLSNELIEDGTYVVTLNADALDLWTDGYAGEDQNPELTFTYTIGDVAAPELVEINWMGIPADNTTVDAMPDGSIQIMLSMQGEEFTESDTLKPTITWNGEDASGWFTTELDLDTYYFYPKASEASNYEGNGKFEATFPDGYFLLDGKEVKGFTYSFNVGSETEEPTFVELNWQAIPADKSTSVSFPTDPIVFMLTEDYDAEITLPLRLTPVTILWNGEDASDCFEGELDAPTYMFMLTENASKLEGNGTLEITFPDGFFLIDGKETAGFSYSFTVNAGEEEEAIWTANPENGGSITTTQNEAPSFVLTFPEGTTLEVEGVDGWKAMWNTADITQYFNVVDRNNTVTFSISSRNLESAGISGEGVYTLTIPTGMIKADGNNVAGFTYVVNVVAPSQQVIKFNDNVTSITPSNVTPLVAAPAGTFTNVVIEMKEAVTVADKAAELVFSKVITGEEEASEITISAADITIDGLNVKIPVTEDALENGTTYTLPIPEGLFALENGDTLTGTTLKFTIGWGTFEPTEADLNTLSTYVTANGWNKIVFKANGDVQQNDVIGDDSGNDLYAGCTELANLKNEAGETVATFDAQMLMVMRGSCNMTIKPAITTPGVYTLDFPAGFWRVGEGVPTEEALSPAFSVDFTVTGMIQTYTSTPDETSFDVFPTVTVTFDGATGITVPEGATADLYKGNDRTESLLTFDLSAVDGKLVITPTEDFKTYAGSAYTKYVIVVKPNTFTIDYDGNVVPNNEVSIDQYKINAPKVVITSETSVSPAVVTSLKELNFSVNGTVTALSMFSKATLYTAVDGAKGTKVLDYDKAINEEKTGFILTFKEGQEELAKGDYCLEIPASYVTATIDGARVNNTMVQFFYTIGDDTNVGLAGINAENGLVDVFTMTGVCVMRQASVEALNGLNPGLYIINGKKVMVK